MLILTGTTHSYARPSQGLATIAVPAPAAPESFKPAPEVPGNWLLEGVGLDALSKAETRAALKPVNAAIASVRPAGKGFVKGVEFWQLSQKALTAFQDDKASLFERLDPTIKAAGSLLAIVKIGVPPVSGVAAFRILDDLFTVGAVICTIYDDATKKPEPYFRYRKLP